ncbi:MAG: hypothetical protein NT007_11815 [Candidatus Kapabacteria bacterium]|nr:hypothetical protein [Candidatus Kapabacteria bacterium]
MVYSLSFDGNTLWAATDSGFAKYADSTWTTYNKTNSPLSSNKVRFIQADQQTHDDWTSVDSASARVVTLFNSGTWTQ